LYHAGLEAKGQGGGSPVGYNIDKGMKYIDMLTSFTNVYNNCDVDYYMIAMSKATGNVAGFVNQITNTLFRNFSAGDLDNYAVLATALDAGDTPKIAESFAVFVKDFLMS
jgi:hypothetical protein